MRSILLFFVLLSPLLAQQHPAKDDSVTAVTGESWLTHLNRPLNQTSMGDTGRRGPPAPMPGDQTAPAQLRLATGYGSKRVLLHGEDLYRLNCRACHGEYGLGAPPEINSVINPVRATSVALIMERMKRLGMDMSRRDVAQLAKQSRAALMLRLHDGGQDMPPFSQLRESELRLLVGHLKQLAGVPGGADKGEPAVQESPIRVGELIVKSTCHICHSAQGTDPSPQQLLDGAIPPLSTLTKRVSRADFIRKVTSGAAISMGTPPSRCRGRMPVFYYLSEEEAGDAYLYLTLYPPNQAAVQAQAAAIIGRSPSGPNSASGTGGGLKQVLSSNQGIDTKSIAYAALLSFLLLLGSIGFTVREFKRLSVTKEARIPGRLQPSSGRADEGEESAVA